jgi:ABC-2 type transport system permease protein
MKSFSFRQKAHITLAIAAKDILDALKNRTILALAFGILVMMLSTKALPFLLALQDIPALAIYDPSELLLYESLQNRTDLKLVRVDSLQELKSLLVDNSELFIGLVVPPDIDLVSGGEEVHLDGYYPNWASPVRVQERTVFFEDTLNTATGAQIQIVLSGNTVYPTSEPVFRLLMITQSSSLMILLVGIILVPYLFLDEKEQRTMDALLVSPASFNQLVAGKALAGFFYCLVAAGVVLLFNFRYVVHWDLTLLAILLGSTFAVLAGLLLGILVDSQASLGLWSGVFVLLLLGPSMVKSFYRSQLPTAVDALLNWTPGTAFNNLLKISMYRPVPAGLVLKDIVVLVLVSALLFALILWRVRGMDR